MKLTRDGIYLLIIILLIALCGQLYYSYHYVPRQVVRVHYNKDVEANRELITVIQDADQFIYFAIYTFTRSDIKDALLGAKHRGLNVRGVIDKEQSAKVSDQTKIVKELQDAGIPIVFQNHSSIMHLKTLVTEKAYFTGSYNWTSSGTNSNDEVIEIGRDELVRKQYQDVVEKLFTKYSN
jgi:phosphatidylserine/phosphatidylglycerophosphate/cardiolipin synthase-like enzyme